MKRNKMHCRHLVIFLSYKGQTRYMLFKDAVAEKIGRKWFARFKDSDFSPENSLSPMKIKSKH